jgi:hypothetical protein
VRPPWRELLPLLVRAWRELLPLLVRAWRELLQLLVRAWRELQLLDGLSAPDVIATQAS